MNQNDKNITLLAFSQYFKKLYEARNISKAELSRLSKVSEATLSRLESGTQQPSFVTLKKLAPHLMVSDEELMIKAGYLPDTTVIDDKQDKMLEQIKPVIIQLCNNEDFLDKLATCMGKKVSFQFFSELVSKSPFAEVIELITSVGFKFKAQEDADGNVNFWLEAISDLSEDERKSLPEMPKLVLFNETNLSPSKSNVKKDSLPLSPKEERDIARDLEKMLSDLESDDAMAFNGETMDDDDKELLRISLENTMRMSKQMAKKKFTPKKYRKED